MKVLVIAPHPDDEVLGCGGTIAKRADNGDEVYICIATKGMSPQFDPVVIERGREEAQKAAKLLGARGIYFLELPALEISHMGTAYVNQKFHDMFDELRPDEIFIPHIGDIHIDHKAVAEAAMVAARPKSGVKRIYAYETVSETGWDIPNAQTAFIPNVYVNITETFEKKIEALRLYESQKEEYPRARSEYAVESLAGYRGSTVNVPYAEAFMLIREIQE